MSERETLGDWLSRGAGVVRADARRALETLTRRGDLSDEEARAIAEAVETSIEQSTRFVGENVIGPLQSLLQNVAATATGAAAGAEAPVSEELLRRLDDISARLERLERRLDTRDGEGRLDARDGESGED